MPIRAMSRQSAAKKFDDQSALDQGRWALRNRAWGEAFSRLSAAEREAPLEPMELAELGQAAYLIGRESDGAEFLTRAHQGFLSCGETQPAVR